ncbi:hypothetical protein AMTR_s03806p00007470, partial [Amborella trichopoda]
MADLRLLIIFSWKKFSTAMEGAIHIVKKIIPSKNGHELRFSKQVIGSCEFVGKKVMEVINGRVGFIANT